ncbi:type II secretion system major pseudopilin GspG [Sphingomonas sp.]|uniref:type II secretion system major pseudopilin GspG n=1 Tax=Sphingomonas sp. TaxID=28214 RepID=UPI0025D33A0E|nr:type II secretion system major pseudopilin GspG [Sphingomonas sp.]
MTRNHRSLENGFTPLRRSAENGFTLVELMVVIVIIGLLTTIVAINVLPSLGKANAQVARTDIATLDQAVEHYRIDNATYPSAADGLRALVVPPTPTGGGGYIKKLPKDPWKRPYLYVVPGQHGPFDITTLGADGVPGGTGENADIGNWQ